MTTSRSSLRILTQKANRIAMVLKQAERGDKITDSAYSQVAALRSNPGVRFALPWMTKP